MYKIGLRFTGASTEIRNSKFVFYLIIQKIEWHLLLSENFSILSGGHIYK